jgi:hypothetical protein
VHLLRVLPFVLQCHQCVSVRMNDLQQS